MGKVWEEYGKNMIYFIRFLAFFKNNPKNNGLQQNLKQNKTGEDLAIR